MMDERRVELAKMTSPETAGLLQSLLLLELQGAHRGDRLEVVVEARDIRSGRSKSLRSRSRALAMRWLWPSRTAV